MKLSRVGSALSLLVHDPGAFFHKLSWTTQPVKKPYRATLGMTLAQWLIHHQADVHHTQMHWMGVQIRKNPLDCWVYQEILFEVRPDVVVEIGSAHGGSTLFFAHLLDLIGHGLVVSVDISRDRYCVTHPRIVTVTGDSSAPDTLRQVREVCDGKKVLLIHDGDHSKAKVLEDLTAYWELVSVGSYLIVEDGVVDQFKYGAGSGAFGDFRSGGPLAAAQEFVRSNGRFEVDRSRERYIITYSPNGFLKRVR